MAEGVAAEVIIAEGGATAAAAAAEGIAAAGIGSTLGGLLLSAAKSFIVSALVSAVFAKKPSAGAFSGDVRDRQVILRSAVIPRRLVYGEVLVGGPLVFGAVTGSGEEAYLNLVIVLAGHEVAAIGEVWFGTDILRDDMLDANGWVISGKYAPTADTPRTETLIVPGTPYQATTAHTVTSVQSVTDANETAFTDVSPASPAASGEYSLSGNTFTFFSDAETGAVTVNYTESTTVNMVRIRKHLGASDQAADSALKEIPGWSADHRLRGCAYLYVAIKRSLTLFPTGLPEIRAVVRGMALYDPRTDAAGWSENPALAVRDYLTRAEGFGCDSSEIDDDLISAAANACEERVLLDPAITVPFTVIAAQDLIAVSGVKDRGWRRGDGVRVASAGALPSPLLADTTYYVIPVGSGGQTGGYQMAETYEDALAGTAIDLTDEGSGARTIYRYDQTRYALHGVVSLDERPRDALQKMLTAMAGAAVYSASTWDVHAGAYRSPAIALGVDDLRDDLEVQPHPERQDLFNEVHGVFVDPAKLWQPTDFPPQQNSTYVAQDGGEVLVRDIELPFTTDQVRAQRLGKIALEKSRQGITIKFAGKLTCWKVNVWDTVELTVAQYGWTDKVFTVTAWAWNPAGGVDLTLQEEAAAVYDWNFGAATETDGAPDTDLPDASSVATPGSPDTEEEIYETRDGNAIKTRALVSWVPSAGPFVREERLEWKAVAADTWLSQPGVLQSDGLMHATIDDIASGYHLFKTLAINDFGTRSAYGGPLLREILGLSAAPAAPTGLHIQAIGGQALITFTQHPEIDVRRGGRILVRFCEDTISPTWEESFSIGSLEGYPGDSVFVLVPLKAGTYLLKAEDATGQQSASAATIDTRQASVLAFSTVGSVTEDPTFPGTHSNTVVDGVTLKLIGTGLFDDIPDLDAIADLDGYGGLASAGTYTFSAGIDLASVKNVRLTGSLVGSTIGSLDFVDERTGNLDDWLDFDGASGGGSTDAYLEVRQTDDDPAGAPTWTGWVRLDAAEKHARAFQFRAQLVTFDPAYNQYLTGLSVAAEEVS